MGIAFALVAAVGWGVADFLARYSTRRIGTFRSLLFMELAGLVPITLWVLPSPELRHLLAHTSWQPWVWAAAASVLGMAGSLALYRAFEVGIISVVSPVCASYAAITVVLAYLSGETLSMHRWIGVLAVVVGVMIASYAPAPLEAAALAEHRRIPRGVGWSLLSAACFGVIFWILGFHVSHQLGNVVPIWIFRTIVPVLLLALARPLGQTIRLPRGSIWWLVGTIGLLDTAGFVAGNVALRSDQVAVVTVILSLFSAVTVLLAWMFLHEPLHRSQWTGIGVILLGVAVVSV